MKFMVKLVILVLVLMFPIMACAIGPKIVKHTACWDANSEPDLAGYYLYWRVPTGTWDDTQKTTVTVSPTPCYDLLAFGLASGGYVIAVTAHDNDGNESGPSNEVTWDAAYPDAPKNVKVQ